MGTLAVVGLPWGKEFAGFFSVLLQCFCDLLALRTVANFLGKTTKCKVGLQTG